VGVQKRSAVRGNCAAAAFVVCREDEAAAGELRRGSAALLSQLSGVGPRRVRPLRLTRNTATMLRGRPGALAIDVHPLASAAEFLHRYLWPLAGTAPVPVTGRMPTAFCIYPVCDEEFRPGVICGNDTRGSIGSGRPARERDRCRKHRGSATKAAETRRALAGQEKNHTGQLPPGLWALRSR